MKTTRFAVGNVIRRIGPERADAGRFEVIDVVRFDRQTGHQVPSGDRIGYGLRPLDGQFDEPINLFEDELQDYVRDERLPSQSGDEGMGDDGDERLLAEH